VDVASELPGGGVTAELGQPLVLAWRGRFCVAGQVAVEVGAVGGDAVVGEGLDA